MPTLGTTYHNRLSRILKHMSDLFAAHLTELGITPKHYGLLLTVQNTPNMTQKDMAEHLGIDRSSTGQFIDLLEEKGYLKRCKHPTDRRAYILELTKKGDALVTTLWDSLQESEQSVIASLSGEEASVFSSLADKILAGIENKNLGGNDHD